ncbi:MAG: UPF0182 family protein [Deltaproteobacteria bacterium]|nr:UPF0182 family protein [Deltaproteobacteria bacterium]
MLKNKSFIFFVLVALTLPFAFSLLNFYTDWLFFVETGFSSVFTTTLYAKSAAGLLFGGVLFVFVQINLYYANRAQFPDNGVYIVGGGSLRIDRDEISRLVRPVSMLVSIVLMLFAANWGAMRWEELLLFRSGVNVGMPDPVIGQDIGFYLFSFPFLEMLRQMSSKQRSQRTGGKSLPRFCLNYNRNR